MWENETLPVPSSLAAFAGLGTWSSRSPSSAEQSSDYDHDNDDGDNVYNDDDGDADGGDDGGGDVHLSGGQRATALVWTSAESSSGG